MKVTKIIQILSFVLILQLFSTIMLINSQENLQPPNDFSINSSIIVIDDFSDFQILYDEPELSSVKTDSHLNFTYTGGSSELYLMRYYYFPFTAYGNCTDFEIQVSIDYDFTGSMYFGKLELIVGSFYNESGDYSGVPNGAVIGYPHIPARSLAKCNVVDAWDTGEGQFRVFTWPNDLKDHYETAHGVPDSSGTATFHMNRFDNELYCQVKQGGTTKIDHTWYDNVSKPANYILIGEGIYGSAADFVNVSFYDFSASLECTIPISESPTPTISAGPQFNLVVFFSFIGMFIILIIYRKTKK